MKKKALNMVVNKDFHDAVKIRALKKDMTIKQYITKLIREDMKKDGIKLDVYL